MTHKKHAENHEEKPKPAEGKDSSEHSAAGAVIHGDAQQKEFSAAHENSHARDKSPSHLHLPTPGNNFKIVGEEHATDRSGKDRKSPPNIRSVTEKELEVKASGGDQYAAFFLKERKNIIDNLPAGEERERALARIQSSADKMFGQKVKESNLKSTQDSEREESTDKFSEKSDDNKDATLDKKSLMSTKEMKVLGEEVQVASLANITRGKIWAWTDRRRRPTKRKKDELDLMRILEAYPELRHMMPQEIR
ncbi:MAG: hypothetical protein IAF58_23180, partial [Leptolyngbya sp.]|nr:hypothetical protein [Candidatus Melainabacteria bacterium]